MPALQEGRRSLQKALAKEKPSLLVPARLPLRAAALVDVEGFQIRYPCSPQRGRCPERIWARAGGTKAATALKDSSCSTPNQPEGMQRHFPAKNRPLVCHVIESWLFGTGLRGAFRAAAGFAQRSGESFGIQALI